MSEAVTVALPAVLSVTLNAFVPLTRAALDANDALVSLDVTATVSFVITMFQLSSTALTVTLKALPAVWFVGAPVLPKAVPGAAVSPGTSNCNFANAPTFTVKEGLVLGVIDPRVISDAVTVRVPGVLSVIVKFFVPPMSAEFVGRLALLSLDVMPTTSFVLLKFQFASTAFTVTVNAIPAV